MPQAAATMPSPYGKKIRGSQRKMKVKFNLGNAACPAFGECKEELSRWREMRSHYRARRGIAAMLEGASDQEINELAARLRAEMPAKAMEPVAKRERTHKASSLVTDEWNAQRAARWEKDIGGDQKGESSVARDPQ